MTCLTMISWLVMQCRACPTIPAKDMVTQPYPLNSCLTIAPRANVSCHSEPESNIDAISTKLRPRRRRRQAASAPARKHLVPVLLLSEQAVVNEWVEIGILTCHASSSKPGSPGRFLYLPLGSFAIVSAHVMIRGNSIEEYYMHKIMLSATGGVVYYFRVLEATAAIAVRRPVLWTYWYC